ncbi:MAG: gallidermin family lantibiotic [Candidatus Rhabdochlamydia sp.]
MQSFHDTQTSHYKEDLYDLDIELKTANPSINLDKNVNLHSWAVCTGMCDGTRRCD